MPEEYVKTVFKLTLKRLYTDRVRKPDQRKLERSRGKQTSKLLERDLISFKWLN